MTPEVVVVGSVNHDLTVFTPRHPQPGETVLGHRHRSGGGGKGANQAVAAVRTGSSTAFIGMVGEDEAGRGLRMSLESEGIEIACLGTDRSQPTGLAVITVDDRGENAIVVSPGANMTLKPGHVSECAALVAEAKVVLAQLEIPLETVLTVARATSGLFCLNPAPARQLPAELLDAVDVLVPNRTELATLTARESLGDQEEVIEAARSIEGPGAMIVTLGSEGALVVEEDDVTPVAAPEVEPVDTTGAGDAFCGALAGALSRGDSLVEAARWAALAGGLATTRPGAQEAMPTREEMESHPGGWVR